MYMSTNPSRLELHERIKELIVSKNKKQVDVYTGIGVDKKTFRKVLDGERYLMPQELAKICEILEIDIKRIKQEDIDTVERELVGLLDSGKQPRRAAMNAELFYEKALGLTEQMFANEYMGRAYQKISEKFEEANEYFEKSLTHAEQIGKQDHIKRAYNNLLIYKYKANQISYLMDILNAAIKKGLFSDDEEQLGKMHQYLGLCAYNNKDYATSKKEYLIAADHFGKLSNSETYVGRILSNIADIEYGFGNYEECKVLLERSIELAKKDSCDQLARTKKDYARVLIASGNVQSALEVIDRATKLIEAEHLDVPDVCDKLTLMKMDITNDVVLGEETFAKLSTSNPIKVYFSNILLQMYISKLGEGGDVKKLQEKMSFHFNVLNNNHQINKNYKWGVGF